MAVVKTEEIRYGRQSYGIVANGSAIERSIWLNDVIPDSFASWNFADGTGNIAGAPKIFSDLWTSNAAWATFTPAEVVNGVGYRQQGAGNDGIVSTAGLWNALDIVAQGGIIYKLYYTLYSPPKTSSTMLTSVVEIPGYTAQQQYVAYLSGRDGIPGYRRLQSNLATQDFPPIPGPLPGPLYYQVAIRSQNTSLQESVDGNAVDTWTGDPIDLTTTTHFGIYLEGATQTGGGQEVILKEIEFWHPSQVPNDETLRSIAVAP